MKSYFIQASAECAYPGEFWKKFKPLLPSKSTQQQHIQRLEEGWLIIDNMEIGNIFNRHFIDGVAAHIPILSEHAFANRLSVNKISRRRNHLLLSFRHVEVGYVKKLIDSLKPKKATGPDKISQRVLTISSEALTVPLTNLINHCITINAWPSLWIDFRASLNNKDHCTAIAVDLSKAFDSISHSLLISKLKAYGFTESAVNLIRS